MPAHADKNGGRTSERLVNAGIRLKSRFMEGIVDRAYGEVTGFIRQKMDNGELPEADAEALAVMITGSLLGYTLEHDVFGRDPAGADEEQFISALVDACMAVGGQPRRERSS
ncbi:MAG: hypothetical protein ACRDK5_11485 [Solirubrobacterales bacterium]